MFEDGSKQVRIVGGPVNFYEDYLVTNLYAERVFGGHIEMITISNDSLTDKVSASFDGATVEAELNAGEALTFSVAGKSSIYIKGDAGGDQARLWGW
jgi:hypothetical protein